MATGVLPSGMSPRGRAPGRSAEPVGAVQDAALPRSTGTRKPVDSKRGFPHGGRSLLGGRFAIHPLAEHHVWAENPRFRQRGLTRLLEHVYEPRPRRTAP